MGGLDTNSSSSDGAHGAHGVPLPPAPLDERLRVRGVDGLRVVDASAMPQVPSGNINAAVMMVGSKAGDLILEDHGHRTAHPAQAEEESAAVLEPAGRHARL